MNGERAYFIDQGDFCLLSSSLKDNTMVFHPDFGFISNGKANLINSFLGETDKKVVEVEVEIGDDEEIIMFDSSVLETHLGLEVNMPEIRVSLPIHKGINNFSENIIGDYK